MAENEKSFVSEWCQKNKKLFSKVLGVVLDHVKGIIDEDEKKESEQK